MRWLLAIALVPATAFADAAGTEVSVGSTLATSTSPSASWVSDRMTGVWDVDDKFELQLDFGVTHSTTTSTTGSLSLSYTPNSHWTLSVTGGYVPSSTSTSDETLEVDPMDETFVVDAQLVATTSQASLSASIGYDTAGDSDHETSGSLTLGVNHAQSQQTFASILDDTGAPITTEDVRGYCAEVMCSPEIEAALSPLWTQLSQFSINGSITRTEFHDVDLSLDATYYLYDKDPTTVGYFRLPGVGASHLGNGLSVSPMRYAIAPSVINRWGKLAAMFNLGYGSYLVGTGYDLSASVKVSYKLHVTDDTTMKLYTTVGSAWSVDDVHDLTTTLSMALGAKYTW